MAQDTAALVKGKTKEELYDRAEELRHDFTSMSEGTRSDEDSERIRKLIEEVHAIDAEITLVTLAENRENEQLASTRRTQLELSTRSFGEMVINEEMVKWVASGDPNARWIDLEGQGTIHEILARTAAYNRARDAGTRAGGPFAEWGGAGPPNYDPSGSGNLLPVGQPIAPVPRMAKLYLRDLLPQMTTTLAAVPYVKEVTPTTTEFGASAVAEGGTKPGAALSFVGAKADPTVVATTLVISKQLFEDAPAVVSYINTRLPYLVKFKEDWEFLWGSGTWPDVQGIFNAGPQTQAATSGEVAITIGNAFADIEIADGAPTFVVLHPTNAWAMFTKRASGGSGTFDAGTPFSALPLTVWGVPTYRTRAIPVGTACVADGDRGAMIVDRESVNVQTYRERYAELNQILLVCEERVGLAIWRPDLFVQTTLA